MSRAFCELFEWDFLKIDVMVENRSAPPGPIVPWLIYKDVSKAIEWLCGAFGFTERLRTPAEPDGPIHHAQLAVGAGSVVLTSGTEVRPASLFVPVADVDAHFERAAAFDTRIVNPPKTHNYGERQYNADDPEGHHWTFSQSVADMDPKDWGAAALSIEGRLALLPRPRWCYLEIPAVDVQQSARFYEKVFGWNIRNRDTGRPSFDDATGNVSGAWVTGRAAASEAGLLAYVWVDSLEATLAQAIAQGAGVVEQPHPDAPGGTSWIAIFRDPAGNLIGLYQEGRAPNYSRRRRRRK
jgi:predicted enzyme related to lactoylglutathione lyase